MGWGGLIAFCRARGQIRLRWNIPRNVPTTWTSHLKFNEVSDGACLHRFPPRLTLHAPRRAEFINIAPAEVRAYLKRNHQQRDDEEANHHKNEEGKKGYHTHLPVGETSRSRWLPPGLNFPVARGPVPRDGSRTVFFIVARGPVPRDRWNARASTMARDRPSPYDERGFSPPVARGPVPRDLHRPDVCCPSVVFDRLITNRSGSGDPDLQRLAHERWRGTGPRPTMKGAFLRP